MNKDSLLSPTTDKTEISLYNTLKILCQKYSEKITGSDKSNVKKLLFKSYEILLKKVNTNFKAIPTEWSDEDVLSALYLHICEYAGDERSQELCRKFHILYENQNTEIYQNSISPIIKMLYSIATNELGSAKKKKHRITKDNWFDTDVVTESLSSIKKYLTNEEMKFFTLPKIHSSQSDSNLSLQRSSRIKTVSDFRPFQLPSSLTFDCMFKNGNLKQEKLSYDLDEGFVTPSDDHKERSPYIDKKIIPTSKTKPFDWDLNIAGVPPRKDRSWEKLDLLGRNKEHHFFPRQVHLQHWLSKAPHSIIKISRNQLIEDLMSLLIGVPSSTFLFNGKTFLCKAGVYTDQHTAEDVLIFTKQYIEAAEAFLALKNLAEKNLNDDIITSAFKLSIKKYLYNYQLIIYHVINGRNNNRAYLSDVQLLIEQVIYLRKVLVQPEELKGVTLLEELFSNMETSSTQMFYLLTSIFLQPCFYYFRLIDDWIFFGKWHKDLPFSPCDFSLIQDRQSWEEAYKPIQSNFLWFIPVQDLAYCGKALSLLSLSKNSEKFLKMLRSDEKPSVKVCLHLEELKQLQLECHNFYEKAKISFRPQKEENLDLALFARESAKMKIQTFEELKKEKMDNEKERKRKELNFREEDLIRSAKVKELKKQEEEFDNMRVAKELEDIHSKEEKREFEKAKEIFNILKQEQAEEEKRELKAEWKLKRQQNNKKRQEFFNDNVLVPGNLIHTEERSEESVIDKKPETEQNKDCNNDTLQVLVESSNMENRDKNLENPEKISDHNEISYNIDTDVNKIKYSELVENRLKVLGSNFTIGDDIQTQTYEQAGKKNDRIVCPSKALDLVEIATATKDDIQSSLKENRLKVLGSNFFVGDEVSTDMSEEVGKKNSIACPLKVMNLIDTTTKSEDIKYSELEDNRLKVLGSNIIVTDDIPMHSPVKMVKKNYKIGSKVLNLIETNTTNNDNIKYTELEINRIKVLHSDFERENKAPLLVYQDEAGKNKQKVLGTHFTLGSDVIIKNNKNDNNEISQTNANSNKKDIDQNQIKPNNKEEMAESNEFMEHALLDSSDSEPIRQENRSISDFSIINVPPPVEEQSNLTSEEICDQSEASEHIGVNGVNWFQKCNQHVEGVKNIFKANNLINLPEKQLDYCSILRCVPGSLNLVLETQLKLVNEALLEMFFYEFQLLTEAGKLKQYFFLDEEFGKRLTCSLCPAIEKEKPLTLLTFGKLRDFLAFASQGDEKLSFIVKETPTAFEHTNPQVLSCLGLSYKFTWPLNLIFTDTAMSKYNDVFECMLSLQRVSWHLDQVWLLLKFRSSQMKGHEYTQIQLYRHIMSQFICSLQWYISTTVFENSWQKFCREVMEVTNFQEVYKKHAGYLKEVIFKCFLNEKSRSLMKRMQSLFKYILIFCQVMRFGEWSISETGDYQHCNFMKLQNTFSSFLKLARYIVRQIEKLVKINYQEGLVNLYNLLTINSFYLA